MDCLYGTASSVTGELGRVAVNELRYPCCFNNLVKDLQIEKDKVVETRNSVQRRIEHAKKQTIETDELVQKWLKEANADINNVEELLKKARTNKSCCFGHCPNWIWRYSLGRQLSQRRRMIKTRNKEGSKHADKQTERRASLLGLGYFTSEKCLKFESRKNAHEQLVEALKSDQVNMIGMYGMGGCGKSTLAKEVGRRAKEEELFDEVLFVVVSSTVHVQSIQEEIACQLEFDLQEKGESQRAQRLHKKFIDQEEKVLVILDNVWEKLDFEAIGIPSPKNHKGCKVLITTRYQDVCSGMDCQRIISLSLLTDEEAWDLFQIQAQITSDNLKHLARLISNECKGLTVLVTAVASTLKGKAEVEWKVALDRLKNSKPVNVEKGLQNPYKCLQLSYDNLDNKEAKSIFLLCCVFPEEHEIPVEDLTRFAIGLGLVGEVHSYDGARNEVCAAKEKLISSCLLLDPGIPGQGKCVKMHDLIRQVALRIAEDEGEGIKCALKKDVTMENTSLRYLWCEKFPYQLDWSNLEFLCLNTYDLEVLDGTFKGMEKLRVLFLVNKGLERRPLLIKSFQSLTNLRCLLLEQWKLGDISFLGDLKKLESITLRRCSFSELPDILVTQLSSLRLLDLSECDMERNVLQVIGKHPQLEELYISYCRSEWDLYDEGTAEFFRKFSIPQALQRYHIQLGEYQEKLLSCCKTLFLSCFDTSNAAIKELAKKTEVLLIANIQGGGAKNIVPDIFQIDEGGMNELIELVISTSKGIKHLVDTGNHLRQVGTIFRELCKLRIKHMEHLESLYHRRPPSGLFEKLEELYIEDCPELHGTLFVWKLNLCRLKVLELDQCPKLISLFTPPVAQSLAQLETLKVLYCGGLKYILEDDNQKKTSTNDHKLVFPKLKQVTVRGCNKLEHIIPVTFAHDLLQLECLEIEVNREMKYVFGQCKHDNQSHTELKINLPLLEKLTLVNLPNIISMCPKNYYPVWPSLHQFTLRNCPEVAIVSIDTYMDDLKGKQCDHSTTEIKKKWSLKEVRAIKKRELVGMFQLAGLSIDEEQDPLGVCLQKLSCTCNGLVQSMDLQNLEQMEVSGCREPKDEEEHQNFLNFHLESNQLEDFPETTSIPSVVNYNSGPFNLSKVKRLILRCCSMLRTLFSPSTATHLTSLEELMITECHGLRYLVTHGNTIENEEEIIQEDHDLQSYAPMFPRLERISVMDCNLLEYIFHVSYAQGLVKLKDIEIWETPSLTYVFGRSIHDNDVHSSHQYQNKIQIELPALEKVQLFNMPNMIYICPGNYHVTCSSLRLSIFMLNVGVSTLSVNFPMVYSGSTYLDHGSTSDILEASMTNVQVLGSVTVWNSSKIKGIFHHDKLPMNGQQATSLLIHLNLANLPELTYIWKGTNHSVALQNLEYLYILDCQKLKVVFSCSVLRSLPQLKILVVLRCEGLEQIIEDDEEHENVSNPAITPKICFSKLKLILVTQCNNLKRLFHLSAPHEFPELEYLVINQVPKLEEVFEAEQGMREGNIEILLPKLSQVILMQLPNLNNISQGIEFETLTDLFVHNCPKLSLTSSTTVEDMLRSCYHDRKIHFLVHSELLFIRDIINKEIAEKDLMLRTSSQVEMNPEDQTASGSEQPSFQVSASNQSMLHNLAGSPYEYEHKQIETRATESHAVLPSTGKNIGTQDSQSLEHKGSLIPSQNLTESIEDAIRESVQEGSSLEEHTKAALSTHTKPGGGDMLAQHSQVVEHSSDKPNEEDIRITPCQKIQNVDDSIQEGSSLLDKEGGTSVVSNDSIEAPPASVDTLGSHYLTAELGAYEDFADIDDVRLALLGEAIATYPHLWNVCEKFSKRFQALMLKILADMLLFLRNESPVDVTPQQEKEFHGLCVEAVQVGFDRSWVEEMQQRVLVRVPEVHHALARLSELHKSHDQLTRQLHEIKSEIDNLNDFIAAQEKCFDFL